MRLCDHELKKKDLYKINKVLHIIFLLSLQCNLRCKIVTEKYIVGAESHRDPYSHKSIIHIIHTILMRHIYLSELSPNTMHCYDSEIQILSIYNIGAFFFLLEESRSL